MRLINIAIGSEAAQVEILQGYFDMVDDTSGATSLTDTRKDRITALYEYLDAQSLLPVCYGLWPVAGGVAASHNINMMTLTRTDFVNSHTHNSSGVRPNGTSAYFKTGVNLFNELGSERNCTLMLYTRTDSDVACIDMGAEQTGATSQAVLSANNGSGLLGRLGDYNISASEGIYDTEINPSIGLQVVTRTANNSLKTYRNGEVVNTTTTTNSVNLPSLELYISAYNDDGTPMLFSNRQWCFAAIFGVGLTATQIFNINVLVEGIQESFNRGVQ